MEYNEDDYLLLSGIQHFAFCRRQWALIHIEQQWQENLRTVEGNILHERAHNEKLSEKRKGLLITRGMAIASRELGLSGCCDVVEFHKDEGGVELFGQNGRFLPVPVEYKRGKPKKDMADELQLCAQAMCLEEMLVSHIPDGYMFYGETKHRLQVEFGEDLRGMVKEISGQMHELYRRRHTPKVKTGSFCRACSLKELCLPKLCKAKNASEYIKGRIGGEQ
ncbi:CRISPR-associated Cas4 family exonuclease [Anaerobacterium chartisolvens]|uniref:CRISPR-associated exonuclease Cas4 n=1 Tax=Anaerobacterium chartisolvens TaxID=1297424 RepID=A0A369BFR9_9FIRM|nr:CRISPR-associated protein Cas4 [Anaerobacterium chartisolvens]RCX20105.1 CRISPR-associated Cas4 family exonuclease [Anaerobacterium chartisolvens]